MGHVWATVECTHCGDALCKHGMTSHIDASLPSHKLHKVVIEGNAGTSIKDT